MVFLRDKESSKLTSFTYMKNRLKSAAQSGNYLYLLLAIPLTLTVVFPSFACWSKIWLLCKPPAVMALEEAVHPPDSPLWWALEWNFSPKVSCAARVERSTCPRGRETSGAAHLCPQQHAFLCWPASRWVNTLRLAIGELESTLFWGIEWEKAWFF